MVRKKEPKKESILHKLIMTAISAAVTAIAAGSLGYYLNTKLPELYWSYEKPIPVAHKYQVKASVENLGRGLATDIKVRFSFSEPILWYTYNYSEGLNGKLPNDNVAGGVSTNEVLLILPRMLPQDALPAAFTFAKPNVQVQIKVFSKEVIGRSRTEWQDKLNSTEKILSNFSILWKSLVYRFEMLKQRDWKASLRF